MAPPHASNHEPPIPDGVAYRAVIPQKRPQLSLLLEQQVGDHASKHHLGRLVEVRPVALGQVVPAPVGVPDGVDVVGALGVEVQVLRPGGRRGCDGPLPLVLEVPHDAPARKGPSREGGYEDLVVVILWCENSAFLTW